MITICLDEENKRIKEDTAIKIKYQLEEKFELERKVRVGSPGAKRRLRKLENRLKTNMIVYASL